MITYDIETNEKQSERLKEYALKIKELADKKNEDEQED